jgi:pilus assembly protein CpaF
MFAMNRRGGDARFPDGTRVPAILSAIAARDPGHNCGTEHVPSLRKSARRKFSLEDMISRGTISVDAASILRRIVNAKLAFLISGGTGSGKPSQPLKHY